MAEIRFERSVRIDAPRERVYAELAEPERQLGLQPLLVSVRELPAEAGVQRFEAVERIAGLGPFVWHNRIIVDVRPADPPHRLDFHARSRGGVTVRSGFRLEAVGEATEVHETVEVGMPWALRPLVARLAVRAQERLLANLKRRLEGGSAPL